MPSDKNDQEVRDLLDMGKQASFHRFHEPKDLIAHEWPPDSAGSPVHYLPDYVDSSEFRTLEAYDSYYFDLVVAQYPVPNQYTVGLMFDNKAKEVLLIKKNRPKFQAGKYNGVGGKLEKGETVRQCMVREFQEESGIHTSDDQWKHIITLEGGTWRVWFFMSRDPNVYSYNNSTDEVLRLVPTSQLHNLPLMPQLYWMIPLALDTTVKFPLIIGDTQP